VRKLIVPIVWEGRLVSGVAAFAFLLLFFGFACGYGIRELISRSRRAAARREYLQRLEMERYNNALGDVVRPKFWLSPDRRRHKQNAKTQKRGAI